MIRHAKGPYESCVRNGDGLRPGDEVCKDVCLGLTVSRGWSSAAQHRRASGRRASRRVPSNWSRVSDRPQTQTSAR